MLHIVRGIPGSGKSTLARALVCSGQAHFHYEADQFFICEKGEYRFEAPLLPKAHEWCQEQTKLALQAGFSVVVSNTFTRVWEMRPYIAMAEYLRCPVTVIHCVGEFGNIHGVPQNAVEQMRSRWETFAGERLQIA